MAIHAERERPQSIGTITFRDLIARLPESLALAKLEMENSGLAKTPEGKYTLTYLLAARDILKPALTDLLSIDHSLLAPVGGHEYNPQRAIDDVGSYIGFALANQTRDIPNLYIRTEEAGEWQAATVSDVPKEESDRFAMIDPLDETSAIPKGQRVQTTGIAIYDRKGDLLSVGITSLVDDAMMFYEANAQSSGQRSEIGDRPERNTSDSPIRVATLKRRMFALRDLPLFTSTDGTLAMESIGGYPILSMMTDKIDTMLDPIKGNPWYEYLIWGPAAEALGFIVTDPDGNPIDNAAIVRRGIEKNPDDQYRVRFVMSRTPEIHRRVLTLLKPDDPDEAGISAT